MPEPETTRAEKGYMAAQAETIKQDPGMKTTLPCWNCRYHATNWFHEVGCPHIKWTPEQLADAERQKEEFRKKMESGEVTTVEQAMAQADAAIAEANADVSDFDVALELTQELDKVKATVVRLEGMVALRENQLKVERETKARLSNRIAELENMLRMTRDKLAEVLAG